MQKKFIEKTADEWLDLFVKEGVPCAPINNYKEVLEDPHVQSMGIVHELEMPNGVKTKQIGYPVSITGFEFEVSKQPPKLGEHNDEVFSEWLRV